MLVDHEGRAVRRAAPTLLPRRGLRALPPVSTRARTSREETAQIGAVRTPTRHGPRRRRTAVGAGPADSPGRTRPVLTPQPAPPPVLPRPVPPRSCRASSPTTTTVPCGLQDRNPPNAVVSARLPQAGRRDPSCHRARADRSARSNFVTGQGPVETPARSRFRELHAGATTGRSRMPRKPALRWMAVTAAAFSVVAAGSSGATVSAAPTGATHAPTEASPGAAACETAPDVARVRAGSTAKEPELYSDERGERLRRRQGRATDVQRQRPRPDGLPRRLRPRALGRREGPLEQRLITAQMTVLNDSYAGRTAAGRGRLAVPLLARRRSTTPSTRRGTPSRRARPSAT